MTVDDLAIAVEVLPPEQLAEHPAYCATRAAEVESAIRSNRRVDTGRLVCGGCHAYISATNHRCRCGFWNDIRSGRNLGRWVEGSSSCKEWETEQEMPF